MAEDEDHSGIGEVAWGQTPDNTATSLAFGSAAMSDKVSAKAELFLETQTQLIGLQTEHLHEQRELILSRLRWGRFSDRFKALLQVMTGVVGIAVAATIVVMAWSASRSNGLLIERFSVPPGLAQRGLTGEVLAAKLLDRLMAMQVQTHSRRPARTYAENWGEKSIKLDIPETGISLGELQDFLRDRLGHDLHVTGEIVRGNHGLSLTARAGEEGAETVTGPEDDIDGLVRRLSESVYRMTQPYRYASYLASHGRPAEALPIFKALATEGPPLERPWGYFGWGSISMEDDGIGALRQLKSAIALEPDNVLVLQYITSIEELNSLPEASLRDYNRMLSVLSGSGAAIVGPGGTVISRLFAQAGVDSLTGDFQAAARFRTLAADIARRQIGEHDVAAARATMANSLTTPLSEIPGAIAVDNISAKMGIDIEAQDWAGAISEADTLAPLLSDHPGLRSFLPATISPFVAEAKSRLGDISGAEALIAHTSAHCDICLRIRAHIAELRGQQARADYWFARAVRDAPSIPFDYADWGHALLARGQPDAAIEKFRLANEKGPHFADPLEMWGEALMAKNRSDLALVKFVEADKYAPNWGRLHLKWGEALRYAGDPDGARKQFAIASGLDLTAADKAELAHIRFAHG